MSEHWADRNRFVQKRMKDDQKKRALAQFGNGRVPPPFIEDPEPTREPKPVENIVVEAVAEAA